MKKFYFLFLICFFSGNLLIAQTIGNDQFQSSEENEYNRAVPYDFGIDKIFINEFPNIKRSPFEVSGLLTNYGTTDITSFTLNYSINGGLPVSAGFVFQNIVAGSTNEFSHTIDWVPTNPRKLLHKGVGN